MTWQQLISYGNYLIAWQILDHLDIFQQRNFAMLNQVTYRLYEEYQEHNLLAFEQTYNLNVLANHFPG